jgi:hypothetical protein
VLLSPSVSSVRDGGSVSRVVETAGVSDHLPIGLARSIVGTSSSCQTQEPFSNLQTVAMLSPRRLGTEPTMVICPD